VAQLDAAAAPATGPAAPARARSRDRVTTRWSERDLVPTLSDLGFINMPALGYWDRRESDDGSVEYGTEALCPELEPRAKLEAERERDPLLFELVKQGNPRVLEGDVFDPSTFVRERAPKLDRDFRIIQYADTAGGRDRERGDYFAEATVAIRKSAPRFWILSIDRGRYAAPEQEARIIKNAEACARRFGRAPDEVVVEAINEGNAIYQRLRVDTRLPLRGDRPVKDKEFRAIPLANAYKGDDVRHAETGRQADDRWLVPFERELEVFPNGDHDDCVDAVSGAYNRTGRKRPEFRSFG
jgi:predicted phage terminase large subunit-like protein